MRGDIVGRDGPFLFSVRIETIRRAGRHVIFRIGYEYLPRVEIDGYAVRDLNRFVRSVPDEIARNDPLGFRIDDGVGDRVFVGDPAPFGAVNVERIAAQGRVAIRQQVEDVGNAVPFLRIRKGNG